MTAAHAKGFTDLPKQPRSDGKNFRSMLPYLWDYRGRVLLALLTLVLAKVANIAVPIVLKELVDTLDAIGQNPELIPILLLSAYGALRLASGLFNELRDAIFARVRYHAMRKLSNSVLKHLHALSLRFHLERKTGAISRDLERGTHSVSSIMNYLVFNIIPTLIEFTLIFTFLLISYDIHFALITIATVVVYILFTIWTMEWRMEFRHTMNRQESKANSQAIDSLINYETVKSFGNERLELKRYDETLELWEDVAVKNQSSMSLLNFGQSTIITVGVTLIMFFATYGVLQGNMTLGDLVLVNTFLLQLFIPLSFLGMIYRAMKHALVDMDLIFKLLDEKPEITDKPDAKDLDMGKSCIKFDNVSFHYQVERPILHDVSFDIPAGHKVAIVGSSGAGKSTIARLLFRFYDVVQGSVQINGQDVRDVTQDSLRTAIGIVPQDTVLFNESIYYNISYAKPNASHEQIVQAAKLAHIHDFIKSLPQGYDTVVGERGLKLSGGEKQRVAIARAILKQPQILIFDEATSSLDSKSEKMIQNALAEIAVNHTTLVIAHRLSTIIDAEQILVMDQGRIIERGTHSELLTLQGTYAHLWQLQQEESTEGL
ncbi:ABC transporter ATP-binding protein/permease [Candidatus Albibeggiatoa sp. nov. NOAA]|uniref:ABCB family ABC transporter ATP-binding protein/permease n=1 Tax=Candidatus Albibeggiatoa sp. nov. NOAA TaxID=3162724 RepID=UPI0032F23653|nr:ABC transporter ATP-binding protein/permease [Thiotrichaceae bacterium]